MLEQQLVSNVAAADLGKGVHDDLGAEEAGLETVAIALNIGDELIGNSRDRLFVGQ